MPFNCRVCGNSDFSEIDGLYYCTECQTQSEDLILQEASQNDFTLLGGNEIKLSQARIESSRKKTKPSFGRPWTIYEAYQIIILAQADSLIALGARDDLKDVVFTIWANYLAKLGVAFCKHEKLVPDIVAKTKYGRFRELNRGTLNNPLNRTKRPLKEKRVSKVFFLRYSLSDREILLQAVRQGDMFLYFQSPIQGDTFLAIRSPEWMNMSKTLAVCYIGLMFTNPNFLPCDIVRFVYESKVPFLSVTHLLPEDMVLSGHDNKLFESIRLDSNALIIETNRLLAYLQLDKMPRPDLTVLVPRFVRELCLPGEIATYCLHLMKMVPFLWKNTTKTGYNKQEVVAMTYIILALKLALGLDDTSELRLSRYSRKLQKLLTPGKHSRCTV
ncbi:unnamed protein product [Candidula unifasciata]|uniref:TATA box-binding protein-associated factor RNA polymerase I subunit B n=1 Tax=Candidula unifasciata TaxID=100452 RepID=A0A8S3ZFC7_9EUPU|nr:unnamed protein product [Candidula unifasciata]